MIKKFYYPFFIFFLLFSSFTLAKTPSTRQVECRVVSVTDGDTVKCLLANNKQIKVRLQEIDAPEKAQPFGNKSKQTLSNLVFKRKVKLVISGYDRYQRTLATIYVNGKNINLEMVRQGMAWAYESYMKDPAYLKAQNLAKKQKKGLWADKNPINPQQWRKNKSKANKAK